jgi:uncharacterized membrane protein
MKRWLLPSLLGLVVAALAWQATLLAIPRGIMSLAVSRLGEAGGLNRMLHAPLPGPGRRTVVRPSPDLAYSSCPFDLSKGPLLVEVAPVAAPYWSLSVFDARTDVAFVRNNRGTGGRGFRVALAMEGQAVPAGVETIRRDDAKGVALLRILVEDRARFSSLDRARRGSGCRTVGA